jgi:SEC-C motif-containing protein
MQSRFSAFAVGDEGYLLATWHPSTRPPSVDLDPSVRWTRLDIVDVVGGGPFDANGVVEFEARYRSAGGRGRQRERSRFVRADGRWFYVSGELEH